MDMETLSPKASRKINTEDERSSIKFKSLYIDMDLAIHRSSNSPRLWRLQNPLDSHEDFEFTMAHKNKSMQAEDSTDLQAMDMEVASADKLFFKGQILPLHQNYPKLDSQQTIMASPKLEESFCENGNSLSRHLRECLSLQPLHQMRRLTFLAPTSENSLGLHDPEKDSSTRCLNEEISNLIPQISGVLHAPLMRCANEERPSTEFSLRDAAELMRSCRLDDSAFDLFQNDSRSSSFRSHHSNNYWSSAEKDSRDSSSSSRCSNGSYQDQYSAHIIQGVEKKAPRNSVSMQLKASHPSIASSSLDQSELCDIMGEFSLNANPTNYVGPAARGSCHGKPPPAPSRSNTRRWSWKGFFTGLRKASKLWVDDGRCVVSESHNDSTLAGGKRPIFTFKELPGAVGESTSGGYRRSVGHDWEWQANTYQFVSREGSMKKGNHSILGSVRDDYEDPQQGGAIYCLKSGGRQEAALSSFDGGVSRNVGTPPPSKREKGKLQGNVWNAKESWNKCINKVKKGTKLSVNNACKQVPSKELESNMNMKSGHRNLMNEEDKMDIYRMMKAKSLSSTPLAKSPVRKAEYGNINAMSMYSLNGSSSYVGLYPMQGGVAPGLPVSTMTSSKSMMKSSNNKKVGFAASCPASMRSSPHHSGLLAVVNKATPDLHTAIQGAIAHCKQSQLATSANPPPSVYP